MELNHPLWSTTDYHHHQYHQADIVRSFKCSFCKRGFSNAQALGGHMNIHRKDRAKLRQLSCNNNDNNDDVVVDEEEEEHNHNVSNYHRIRRLKRSSNKGIENHHHQLQQQLPLFIEATQWVGHVENHHDEENYDEDEDLFPELDLELRLGPEPDHHDRMAACLGTRNFF